MGLVWGLDPHGPEWVSQHTALERDGWNAIGDFIRFMKTTLDPNGKPYWDRTTVIVGSEFARARPASTSGRGAIIICTRRV